MTKSKTATVTRAELRDMLLDLVRIPEAKAKNPHYYKDVERLRHVDVYRVLHMFEVTHPCIQHAIKKLLVPGARAGGKGIERDISEAIQSLQRWQEMHTEDDGSHAP